jgi:glycoprotein endo-alpha-1,2-mannosidase
VWPEVAAAAHKLGLVFLPSVGPGYVDVAVRPWNAHNIRDRADGQYYRQRCARHGFVRLRPAYARDSLQGHSLSPTPRPPPLDPHSFAAAMQVRPPVITVTSMNEWHEGTQIERASPHHRQDGTAYADYGAAGPDMYLDLTAELVSQWRVQSGRPSA